MNTSKVKLIICVATFLSLLTHSVCNNNNAAVLLAQAGQDLAFRPLANDGNVQPNSHPKFVEPARFDDLATTRLQVKTNDVVDKIWENINDGQRFAIIKDKGAAKEVLKMANL